MHYSRLRAVLVCTSVVFAFVVFGLVGMPPAQAQANDNCPLKATVHSLQVCVQHAAEQGLINNQGVANSLLRKLEAAQQSIDRNQPTVAISQLQVFIREVKAQAGKHIDQVHAEHMIAHAQVVIQALELPSEP